MTPDKVDPREKERYIGEFYQAYKSKDVDIESARRLFEDTLYYAAMLTRDGKVDGMVAGRRIRPRIWCARLSAASAWMSVLC